MNIKKTVTALACMASVALAQTGAIHEAQIKHVVHAGSYTYLGVKSGEREYWVVTSPVNLPVETWIRFKEEVATPYYESKALGQRLEDVVFTSSLEYRSHLDERQHLAYITEKVAVSPYQAKGTVSIQEAQEGRKGFAGKTIEIRAKVVKVSQNILGRNWVHLQDGTGSGEEIGRIVATSSALPKVGEIVRAKGKVSVDKDFGSGYVYAIVLEETVFGQ